MGSKSHSRYMMTVLSGPHAGAEISLDGSRQRLGSDPSNDIRLTGTAPETLRFRLSGDKLSLRPTDNVDIAARDAQPFEVGKTATMRLPAHLTIDGATSIYFFETPPERRRVLSPALSVAVVASLGLFAAVKPTATGLAEASILATSPVEITEPLVEVVAAPPARPLTEEILPVAELPVIEPVKTALEIPVPCQPCEEEAAAAFEKILSEQGLTGIKVIPEIGIIRVVTSGLAAGDIRWQAARSAYDALWESRVPLLLQKGRPVPKAPFAIASVWLGESPELETRDGITYRIGDTTPDGWKVTDIQSGQVDVSMGEDRVRIEF